MCGHWRSLIERPEGPRHRPLRFFHVPVKQRASPLRACSVVTVVAAALPLFELIRERNHQRRLSVPTRRKSESRLETGGA